MLLGCVRLWGGGVLGFLGSPRRILVLKILQWPRRDICKYYLFSSTFRISDIKLSTTPLKFRYFGQIFQYLKCLSSWTSEGVAICDPPNCFARPTYLIAPRGLQAMDIGRLHRLQIVSYVLTMKCYREDLILRVGILFRFYSKFKKYNKNSLGSSEKC